MKWRESKAKRKNPETVLTNSIRGLLKTFRILHWKQWQGMGSTSGVADIIGVRTVSVDYLVQAGVKNVGVFFACEVKMPGRQPTPAQQAFLDNVREAGGFAFVARGLEEVIQRLAIKVAFPKQSTLESASETNEEQQPEAL